MMQDIHSSTRYEVYLIEDDKMEFITEINSAGNVYLVYYNGYIVTNEGIYTEDWKLVAPLDYGSQLKPLVVGGNVYIRKEEGIVWPEEEEAREINLPEVGEGWYKLDIEEYINN
jgi:hypothetical protein